jgi:hypothetical protein
MEFAQSSSNMYDNRYLLNLLGNGKQV